MRYNLSFNMALKRAGCLGRSSLYGITQVSEKKYEGVCDRGYVNSKIYSGIFQMENKNLTAICEIKYPEI